MKDTTHFLKRGYGSNLIKSFPENAFILYAIASLHGKGIRIYACADYRAQLCQVDFLKHPS